MIKYLSAYFAIAVTMVIIDLLWLGVIAKPIYQRGIGHLMAETPNITFAIVFYLLYPIGLMIFALTPNESAGWGKTSTSAALFGFFAYATYDLTNLATLKNWPIALSIVDVSWGTLISTTSAAAGKYVLDQFANQ